MTSLTRIGFDLIDKRCVGSGTEPSAERSEPAQPGTVLPVPRTRSGTHRAAGGKRSTSFTYTEPLWGTRFRTNAREERSRRRLLSAERSEAAAAAGTRRNGAAPRTQRCLRPRQHARRPGSLPRLPARTSPLCPIPARPPQPQPAGSQPLAGGAGLARLTV